MRALRDKAQSNAKCERYAKDQSVVRAAGIARKSKVGCELWALRERAK